LFGGVSNKLLVHVIQVKGGYRVFHVKDDAFQAKFFKTPREAKQFLKTIKKPFELGSLSPKLIKEDSYIKKRLTGILGEGNFTQRIKDTYSGKRKIFDLIDNMGGRYPVSRLKDTLGYRIVTDTKKEVLRKVRLIKKDLKAKNEFVTVKQVDKKKKKQTGYRAKHIIAKTPEGQLYEIQVMTAVMKKWHAWDHKMVYKSDYPKGEYLDKLIKYSRAVAGYARNLEDGVKSSMPDYKEFGILEKDAFPDGI
jgi:ppGpp synthetase/RelA/SpoT-type nucleotidyltranferase